MFTGVEALPKTVCMSDRDLVEPMNGEQKGIIELVQLPYDIINTLTMGFIFDQIYPNKKCKHIHF